MKRARVSIALVACVVIALCAAGVAFAKKPGGKGGGGVKPACFLFLENEGDKIRSDQAFEPYCNAKKGGFTALVSQDGHLGLTVGPGSGRSVFVDWTLGPGNVPLAFDGLPDFLQGEIYTTDDLVTADLTDIPYWSEVQVAGWNDAIDLRAMAEGETLDNVNVRVNLLVFTEAKEDRFEIWQRFEPLDIRRSCPPGVDSRLVDVTCLAANEQQCYYWEVRADRYNPETGAGDLACVGLDFVNNESYSLPFTLQVCQGDSMADCL